MDSQGYEDLGFQKPGRIGSCMEKGLIDTRAQVMTIGLDLAKRLGVMEEEMMGTNVDIKELNEDLLNILDGIPVILRASPSDKENVKETHQIAYVVSNLTKMVVHRAALFQMGLLKMSWPLTGIGDTAICTQNTQPGVIVSNDRQLGNEDNEAL